MLLSPQIWLNIRGGGGGGGGVGRVQHSEAANASRHLNSSVPKLLFTRLARANRYLLHNQHVATKTPLTGSQTRDGDTFSFIGGNNSLEAGWADGGTKAALMKRERKKAQFNYWHAKAIASSQSHVIWAQSHQKTNLRPVLWRLFLTPTPPPPQNSWRGRCAEEPVSVAV